MELRKRIQKGSTTEKSSTKRNIAEKNTAKEKIIEHSLAERGITLVALVVTMVLHYDKVKKCSNSNSFLLSSI